MKRFNLEEYLAHPERKVVTRKGDSVRILCTDADCNGSQIVAIVTGADGENRLLTYFDNGQYYFNMEDEDDLFLAPNKKEGWINICKYPDGVRETNVIIYSDRTAATETISCIPQGVEYLDTVKIEWEE